MAIFLWQYWKILFFIIILQWAFNSLKTSGKSKPTCIFITRSVPRRSFCHGPSAAQVLVVWVALLSGRPTCEADALGAVAQVHHHSNLQGREGHQSRQWAAGPGLTLYSDEQKAIIKSHQVTLGELVELQAKRSDIPPSDVAVNDESYTMVIS